MRKNRQNLITDNTTLTQSEDSLALENMLGLQENHMENEELSEDSSLQGSPSPFEDKKAYEKWLSDELRSHFQTSFKNNFEKEFRHNLDSSVKGLEEQLLKKIKTHVFDILQSDMANQEKPLFKNLIEDLISKYRKETLNKLRYDNTENDNLEAILHEYLKPVNKRYETTLPPRKSESQKQAIQKQTNIQNNFVKKKLSNSLKEQFYSKLTIASFVAFLIATSISVLTGNKLFFTKTNFYFIICIGIVSTLININLERNYFYKRFSLFLNRKFIRFRWGFFFLKNVLFSFLISFIVLFNFSFDNYAQLFKNTFNPLMKYWIIFSVNVKFYLCKYFSLSSISIMQISFISLVTIIVSIIFIKNSFTRHEL